MIHQELREKIDNKDSGILLYVAKDRNEIEDLLGYFRLDKDLIVKGDSVLIGENSVIKIVELADLEQERFHEPADEVLYVDEEYKKDTVYSKEFFYKCVQFQEEDIFVVLRNYAFFRLLRDNEEAKFTIRLGDFEAPKYHEIIEFYRDTKDTGFSSMRLSLVENPSAFWCWETNI